MCQFQQVWPIRQDVRKEKKKKKRKKEKRKKEKGIKEEKGRKRESRWPENTYVIWYEVWSG